MQEYIVLNVYPHIVAGIVLHCACLLLARKPSVHNANMGFFLFGWLVVEPDADGLRGKDRSKSSKWLLCLETWLSLFSVQHLNHYTMQALYYIVQFNIQYNITRGMNDSAVKDAKLVKLGLAAWIWDLSTKHQGELPLFAPNATAPAHVSRQANASRWIPLVRR